ncbi:hypothetical protein B0T19DRAFT_445976 [Cercophora scortea]|uniref:Uncharacterized protein n=1 Tax=Cercophora scortea TaxID=314031 RepID=A0AAE0I8R6_9PEZI|nr:hypothetical protein B0T19DRAFT_445976 [Cercophora scortea]
MSDATSTSHSSPNAGVSENRRYLIPAHRRLDRLPVEVIKRICDFVIGRPPVLEEIPSEPNRLLTERWNRFYAGRRSICLGLCHTSRYLCRVARRSLYRDVVLEDRKATWDFLVLLANKPERRILVRSLMWRIWRPESDAASEPAASDPGSFADSSEGDDDDDEMSLLALQLRLSNLFSGANSAADMGPISLPHLDLSAFPPIEPPPPKGRPDPEAPPWDDGVEILIAITKLAHHLECLRLFPALVLQPLPFPCRDLFKVLSLLNLFIYVPVKWCSARVARVMKNAILPDPSIRDWPCLGLLRSVELEVVDDLTRPQFLSLGFQTWDGLAEGSTQKPPELRTRLESVVLRFFDPLFLEDTNHEIIRWLEVCPDPGPPLKRLEYQQYWLHIEKKPEFTVWHLPAACGRGVATPDRLRFRFDLKAVSSTLESLRMPLGFFGYVEGIILRPPDPDDPSVQRLTRLKHLEINIDTLFRQICPLDADAGFDPVVLSKILRINQYFELFLNEPIQYSRFREEPPEFWDDTAWLDSILTRLPPGIEDLVLVEWWPTTSVIAGRRTLG